MVFDATFNHISVISWRSVLLVAEAGVPEKKNTDLLQVTDKQLIVYIDHKIILIDPLFINKA